VHLDCRESTALFVKNPLIGFRCCSRQPAESFSFHSSRETERFKLRRHFSAQSVLRRRAESKYCRVSRLVPAMRVVVCLDQLELSDRDE